jgi:DNA end-binding protein Ku
LGDDDYFADIPNPRISKDVVDVAAHILDTKASKFDLHKFKDKYEIALRELVKRKVFDLMDALKQSLGRKQAGASSAKGGKRTSVNQRHRRRSA